MQLIPNIIPVGLVVIVLLTWLALALQRGSESARSDMSNGTRFFLVVLRLAIGWQLLVEGWDKIKDPAWTSEGYLRGAQGPAAPAFRNIAGDTLRDRLTPGADDAFPAALESEWRAYLDTFQQHYQLDPVKPAPKKPQPEEKKKKETLDLKTPVNKADTAKKDEASDEKIPDPKKLEDGTPKKPASKEPETKKKKAELAPLPTPSQKEHSEVILKQQKMQTLRWLTDEPVIVEKKPPRGDAIPLQKTVKEWLKELDDLEEATKRADATRWRAEGHDPQAWARQIRGGLKRGLDEQTAMLKAALKDILTEEQELLGTVPHSSAYAGGWLRWSDFLVKWGLAIGGACLIAGFFTRPAAVLGAILLLSFYLAMPPLPWLPENPRAEGHYLFINKTLIEAIALLAIATTRSGRWFGIDGLLQFIFPSRWHTSGRK